MDNDKTGGPAYPFQGVEFQELRKDQPGVKTLVDVTYPGMTLLDHFAGLAMQGLLGDTNGEGRMTQPVGLASSEIIAGQAYHIAAAMIAERNRIANS